MRRLDCYAAARGQPDSEPARSHRAEERLVFDRIARRGADHRIDPAIRAERGGFVVHPILDLRWRALRAAAEAAANPASLQLVAMKTGVAVRGIENVSRIAHPVVRESAARASSCRPRCGRRRSPRSRHPRSPPRRPPVRRPARSAAAPRSSRRPGRARPTRRPAPISPATFKRRQRLAGRRLPRRSCARSRRLRRRRLAMAERRRRVGEHLLGVVDLGAAERLQPRDLVERQIGEQAQEPCRHRHPACSARIANNRRG